MYLHSSLMEGPKQGYRDPKVRNTGFWPQDRDWIRTPINEGSILRVKVEATQNTKTTEEMVRNDVSYVVTLDTVGSWRTGRW